MPIGNKHDWRETLFFSFFLFVVASGKVRVLTENSKERIAFWNVMRTLFKKSTTEAKY